MSIDRMNNHMKLIIAALVISLTSACSIYRLGARQGNEITAEKLQQAQQAQTREEIVEALGTPLLRDPFRSDRWDYVYYYSKHGEEDILRRLTVWFDDNQVRKLEHAGIPPLAEETSDTTASSSELEVDKSEKEVESSTENPSALGSDN